MTSRQEMTTSCEMSARQAREWTLLNDCELSYCDVRNDFEMGNDLHVGIYCEVENVRGRK